ncbi:hypothetical protein FOZ61_009112 [Perkinsus olseni]|uniref:Uncharacterized protein n=1 Tax=Perkinsus olseni TaxID=32597 RepID=A0A7J6M5X5_PEROL|nr:hypothetical protein FOZ61_009112 [Perkinsus olseni]
MMLRSPLKPYSVTPTPSFTDSCDKGSLNTMLLLSFYHIESSVLLLVVSLLSLKLSTDEDGEAVILVVAATAIVSATNTNS